MKQGKACLVSTLGFHEHELCVVKTILKLTHNRPQGSYQWNERTDHKNSDVAIINADDESAMAAWREMAAIDHAPMSVLVTSKTPENATERHFVRPINPAKMLSVLDLVADELKIKYSGHNVFSGKNSAEPAGFARMADGSQLRRALVVDDSPTVRRQLESELRAFGFDVDLADTGEAGLNLLEKNSYDMIFLDVVLPGTDGYQVCKAIRKNPAFKRTRVVLLTSKSSPIDRVRGTLAGCDIYLTKPVSYEDFRQVLGMDADK